MFIDRKQDVADQDVNQIFDRSEILINQIFGDDSVLKIFGVEHPSDLALMQFVVQLTAIVGEFRKKEVDRIMNQMESKYVSKSKMKLNEHSSR